MRFFGIAGPASKSVAFRAQNVRHDASVSEFSNNDKGDRMKLLLINGSPRKAMNTAAILEKIAEGARSAGGEAELVHLIEHASMGCINCFRCKEPGGKHYGRCAILDDLTPILEKAHEADVLVLGSPFYYGTESSLMRTFMERLWYQYTTFSLEEPTASPRKKAVALVYTMHVKEGELAASDKSFAIKVSKETMEFLFAPCEVFLCCDTLHVNDYGKYAMTRWNVPEKLKRRAEVFPQDLAKAFNLGARLAR